MIGISIHRNEVTYLQLDKRKQNFSVSTHGKISYKKYDEIITNAVKDIASLDDMNKEDKAISFVVDSEFCLFNEVFCEDGDSLNFHQNLSGNNRIADYMDSYYYPINNRDDSYLGIHINKNIKSGLISSVESSNYSLRSIGIGLFSAEMMARSIFGAHALDNYLVIRFITSNLIEVLYINDGILMLYGKYKISGNSVYLVKAIGNKKDSQTIISFLDHLRKTNRINTKEFNKVFIYQSSGNSPIIKKVIKNKNKNVVLLDLLSLNPENKLSQSTSEIFKNLKFAEHGQLFRGINV